LTRGRAPFEICLARSAAMITRANRLGTLSKQSSTVTRATALVSRTVLLVSRAGHSNPGAQGLGRARNRPPESKDSPKSLQKESHNSRLHVGL
jgi:hypothetical protein